MPGGDGTGPMGRGPMRGRLTGYCAGYETPGFSYPGSKRNKASDTRRTGGGRRSGFRHMYYATGLPGWARSGMVVEGLPAYNQESVHDDFDMDSEREKKILKSQVKALKGQLNKINKRIEELESLQEQS
ncbi:DUF5320 domain-containing protein [Natranaerobius thermophilus]|uniref:DUF5320 domain-containing protein n=1 Tax=Natranaerobius thermophilus (strain ATCC BAA-1301 / DSM 18059 / JW/NM-WN-LF) TaxID=457570 RepID=B2A0V4_NATTJ|nr:DUF5320 domain-containing protein [Natranaerobius thermophilus]ACB85984.1 conserved hypothetical protein [Natranaerobius thermophilus JW/NM-WN-LF]